MVAQTVPLLFDQLTGQMLLSIFGSPLLLGMCLLFLFYVFGLALRLTFEVQLLAMFFFIYIVIAALIPQLAVVLFVALGIFVGLFLINLIFRG